MSNVVRHTVALDRCEIQPSDDHVVFVSGNLDAKMGIEVPNECHYMPLATWMGMGTPETVTIQIVVGNVVDQIAESGE